MWLFQEAHQSQHRAGEARRQPEKQWGSGAGGGVVSRGASALGALGFHFQISFSHGNIQNFDGR